MYVKYDDKKETILIEVSKRQFATILASVGRCSGEELTRSKCVNPSHLSPNYPIFTKMDDLYHNLCAKGKY